MSAQGSRPEDFEISSEDFEQEFTFEVEDGLAKTVQVRRKGRGLVVNIRYQDDALSDHTDEAFEADGAITITAAEGGIFISSFRSLLSDRVRLRRTRFF
ncbi:hypothetical protein E2F50_11110 [Rhizobium deserti]|uniref:Uncharacterized protein n=1 Tax=Rhizobium deserti TaxID=2547961 RepID=A0A4R5UKI0_9HYPH|nr:hypothetical protein [Rhizobium deserti]TDK37407.1 hypothetical protein E2F50_11110 [Rhizobium deserti]